MRTQVPRKCAPKSRHKPLHGNDLRPHAPAGSGRTGRSDGDGSDPASGRPGCGVGPCVLSHATAPARSLPSMDPCGKAGGPKPEATGNIMSLGTAERCSTRRPHSGSSRRPLTPRAGLRPRCDRGARDADAMRRSGVHGGLVSGWQRRPRVARQLRRRDTGCRLEEVVPGARGTAPRGGCHDCNHDGGGREDRPLRRPSRPPVRQGKFADADRPGTSRVAADGRPRLALVSGSGLAEDPDRREVAVARIVRSVIEQGV